VCCHAKDASENESRKSRECDHVCAHVKIFPATEPIAIDTRVLPPKGILRGDLVGIVCIGSIAVARDGLSRPAGFL
jgi:hypothetical protein